MSADTTPRRSPSGRPAPLVLGAGLVVLAGWGFGVVGGAASDTGRWRHAVYREGPPPGFTGGFGEDSCHACHFSEEPNAPPGTLTLVGLPEAYAPGERYLLEVMLIRPGLALAGFELAARSPADSTQAGTLLAPPEGGDRVAVVVDRGIQYVRQTTNGSEPFAPDTARWQVWWEAPASGGRVRFDASASAADGDSSASGDFVYTATFEARSR